MPCGCPGVALVSFGCLVGVILVLSFEFRVTFGCLSGAFRVFSFGFRVTFGCPFAADKWPTRIVLALFSGAPRLAL